MPLRHDSTIVGENTSAATAQPAAQRTLMDEIGNELGDALLATRRQAASELAPKALSDTIWLLSPLPEELIDRRIVELIERDAELLGSGLDYATAGTVLDFVSRFGHIIQKDAGLRDLTATMNVAAVLMVLLHGWSNGLPGERIAELRPALVQSIDRLSEHVLVLAEPQVSALLTAVRETASFLSGLSLGGSSRVILLELPVGNSIPCKLLEVALQRKGVRTERVRVSLNRNDKSSAGVTREELLIRTLGEIALQKDDIVVLMDEWISGSNFSTVTRLIARIATRARAFFLPVAMVTAGAEREARHGTYVQQHDRLLGGFGVGGARFHFQIPPLKTVFPRRVDFFWSEYDRLAGYRKMQFTGSVVSSLYAAVEALKASDAKLAEAREFILAVAANQGRTAPRSRGIDPAWLRSKYDRSYDAFQEQREQLANIQHRSNDDGVAEEPDQALMEVCEQVRTVLADERVRFCVNHALAYEFQRLNRDPADRYYFPGHAPVIVELEGEMRLMHDAVMAHLFRRLEQTER